MGGSGAFAGSAIDSGAALTGSTALVSGVLKKLSGGVVGGAGAVVGAIAGAIGASLKVSGAILFAAWGGVGDSNDFAGSTGGSGIAVGELASL